MPRALRPRRVDEPIMYVLLGVVDDALDVARGVVRKVTESSRIVPGQVVMTSSNGRVQIANKQPDELFLVQISNRQGSCESTPFAISGQSRRHCDRSWRSSLRRRLPRASSERR